MTFRFARHVFVALSALAAIAVAWVMSSPLVAGAKTAAAPMCTDAETEGQTKENPNKMLFISCGGFL